MIAADVLAAGVDGVLFPSPPGTAVDVLRAMAAPAPADRPVRWQIGSPEAEGFFAVLTQEEIGDGLWLPHHRAVLHSAGGPVAVRVRDGVSSITWSDGVGASLAAGDRDSPVRGDVSRFVRLPAAFGVPVLNAVPEVASAYGDFEPLPAGEAVPATAALAEGLLLLGEVWPEAQRDVLRLCRGVVLLAPREWSRSHSPTEQPGVVLLTVDGPEKVADLLCHECSHVRLNILLAADPLLLNGDEGGHPSPWRTDPRPLLGLLLGVHAFVAVVAWYQRLQASRHRAAVWDDVLERQSANVRAGWATLSASARPTPTGEAVLTTLGTAVEEVCAGG